MSPVCVKAVPFALESAYIKFLSIPSVTTTVYRVNSLLPTDFKLIYYVFRSVIFVKTFLHVQSFPYHDCRQKSLGSCYSVESQL